MHQELRSTCRGCRAVSGGRLLGCMHRGKRCQMTFADVRDISLQSMLSSTLVTAVNIITAYLNNNRSIMRISQSIMRKLASGLSWQWIEVAHPCACADSWGPSILPTFSSLGSHPAVSFSHPSHRAVCGPHHRPAVARQRWPQGEVLPAPRSEGLQWWTCWFD